MLIERRALDTILGTQETTQPSEQGRSGHRVVAPVSPDLVMRLSRMVMWVSGSGALRLEQRSVRPEPEPEPKPVTLAELRQHPIVRIAYLESVLCDILKPNSTVPIGNFDQALIAEGLTMPGEGEFSHVDKLSIIDYLQTRTIPSCEKDPGETRKLEQVKETLWILQKRFEEAICDEPRWLAERESTQSQLSEDDTFEGNDSDDEAFKGNASDNPDVTDAASVAASTQQPGASTVASTQPQPIPAPTQQPGASTAASTQPQPIPAPTQQPGAGTAASTQPQPIPAPTQQPGAGASTVASTQPQLIPAPTQQPGASTAASTQPQPISAPYNNTMSETEIILSIQRHISSVYGEDIYFQDLDYFRKILPDADWSSDRLYKELAWFNRCNRYGEKNGDTTSRKYFARLHNEGVFTDRMLSDLNLPRNPSFDGEMRIAAGTLRLNAMEHHKPFDGNILIANIKSIFRTTVNKLRALYQSVTIFNSEIEWRLNFTLGDNITIQDVDYFRKSLPYADWGSDRLLKELAFFNCCNRHGAGIDKKEFARLHNERVFTDIMLAMMNRRRNQNFAQEMNKAAATLRTISQTPPKIPPRR